MRAFNRAGERARVRQVKTQIGPEVDAADHQIGASQHLHAHHDAISWRAVHAVRGDIWLEVIELGGVHPQWAADRDAVTDAALFDIGRDEVNSSDSAHRVGEGFDAGAVHTVIVADENQRLAGHDLECTRWESRSRVTVGGFIASS